MTLYRPRMHKAALSATPGHTQSAPSVVYARWVWVSAAVGRGRCRGMIRRCGVQAMLLEVALFCYAFVGLAIVCDDYMVTALEQVHRRT